MNNLVMIGLFDVMVTDSGFGFSTIAVTRTIKEDLGCELSVDTVDYRALFAFGFDVNYGISLDLFWMHLL